MSHSSQSGGSSSIKASSLSASRSKSSLDPSSPPPPASNPPHTASFDSLLTHLLASKRSLSIVDHVYRANDLCTLVRQSAEHAAVLSARTSFLRSGIAAQLDVLDGVAGQASTSSATVGQEYEDIVAKLDDADARLRDTLQRLRDTMVESVLRPEGEERKCLMDFVYEGGVETVVDGVKGDMHRVHGRFESFDGVVKGWVEDVNVIRSTLVTNQNHSPSSSASDAALRQNPIPHVFAQLEDRAKEMALSLESLVRHFDLCVTALKYTDGGDDNAALKQVADDLPSGVDVRTTDEDTSSRTITEEERTEMIRVLEDDAAQVEDVVMEMKTQVAEMEGMYGTVETYMADQASEHDSVNHAFDMLADAGRKLPNRIAQLQAFQTQWNEDRLRLEGRLDELDDAKRIYSGFLGAYDNLIIEIGRRKAAEARMLKVVQEASEKLERLYEADAEQREAFRSEQGEFLPVDVWPGVLDAPVRFTLDSVDGSAGRVPDIEKSVVHAAIRRVHGQPS